MTHSSFVGKRTAPSPSSPARSTRKSAKPLSSSRGFGHAYRATVAFEACPRPRGSGSSATTSTPWAASERATARPVIWQLKTSARGRALDAGKSGVEVRDDVLRVLDPDRETKEAVADAEPAALLGRQPAVRRDGWVEDLGEEVADRRRGGRQLEGVEEAEGRVARVVLQHERHDPTEPPGELPLRQLVLRMVRKPRVAHAE